ncbi:hypothetical protein DL764_004557 [Monosporascus ibericus]|uniref:Beta-lactamase-related domain-containing protein n=1 Tax=Monosporascus ibericus TaxID=155417 RepID=A0A4Q4TEZ9_9PEZI|nr:hypothetical protein DL764_004557 [Monosporascus ibericus]
MLLRLRNLCVWQSFHLSVSEANRHGVARPLDTLKTLEIATSSIAELSRHGNSPANHFKKLYTRDSGDFQGPHGFGIARGRGRSASQKSRSLSAYNNPESTGGFRADWAYSNWGYATAGEVVKALSGASSAQYMEELLRPLDMDDICFGRLPVDDRNLAETYAAHGRCVSIFDLMPSPAVTGGTITGPAMEDLMKYATALFQTHQLASMQLSDHIFTARSPVEESYAFGFCRSQLPGAVLGMGWNSIYIKKMPALVPKGHAGPAMAPRGSRQGIHIAMAFPPELGSRVVCTNSITIGDVSE